MKVELTCSECGTGFDRPGGRGPVPTRCLNCKKERRRVQHAAQELARIERRRAGTYKCGHCGETKPGTEFAASQLRDGSWCKQCFRASYLERSGGLVTKTCPICATDFDVTRRNERQKFCSEKCKDREALNRKAARLLESKRGRVCAGCGGEIPPEKKIEARYWASIPSMYKLTLHGKQHGLTLGDPLPWGSLVPAC